MKKSILIIGAVMASLSLMAFALNVWNSSENHNAQNSCKKLVHFDLDPLNIFESTSKIDFVYNIDTRFNAGISIEDLMKATSALDIVPKDAGWEAFPVQSLTVTAYEGDLEIQEVGNDLELNLAQKQLLTNLDYSDHFSLRAPCKGMHNTTGEGVNYDLFYIFTVIPETQAKYSIGEEGLINYLKENSQLQIEKINENQLKPGRVNFTVTKTGKIDKVSLDSTSGYPSLDKKMIDLISKIPGEWQPASDSNGIHVDQELVFFYGKQGC